MLALPVVASGVAAAAPQPIEYVALGDSAAAGPLIPDQDTAQLGCLRSNHNYPSVVAADLGARLTDVSCSSARTVNLTDVPQSTVGGPVARQIDALGPTTDLVTITSGANDFGLVTTALSCVNPLPQPTGFSCRDRFTKGGQDQQVAQIDAWAPAWGAMLDRVRERAPQARVAVIGYGTYIRPGGCPGTQPIWPQDADYLQSVIAHMNAAMAAQARSRGVEFVDITAATAGHDICAEPAGAYYTGVVPGELAVPLHPTALGMRAIGAHVAQQLR
ncbi:SGNH/GDSL hydrolase family protein [Rhodococcus sp. NPDC059234]|uniref:SGNH/GDSL hydrolase family protein n=1 Tax=Rhodococcus sp. NPDC059234 TaxID=3346781 RepID=UPI00366CF446